MDKYFLIENDVNSNLLFWRPNGHGYTQDMTKAGIYTGKERVECPIITSNSLDKSIDVKSFYININDIELLGNTVIINKVVVNKHFKIFGGNE